MEGVVLGYEPVIRLGMFAGVFVAVALAEGMMPRRQRAFSRWRRWPSNLGIVALDTVLVRLLFPVAVVGVAVAAEGQRLGFFNAFEVPRGLAVLGGVVLMDLAIYLQHVMFHAVPALWRLHRMHHADLDYDVTTGARFHPIEVLLSMLIKLAVVAALGVPAVAVVIFEVALNATAMFNHGNLRLPAGLDRVLRRFVVTPDMHRVHHSIRADEANSNFGFNLPWWDRLLGTYKAQPADGHEAMTIGLDVLREPVQLRLDRMLIQPFVATKDVYAINQRTWEGDPS